MSTDENADASASVGKRSGSASSLTVVANRLPVARGEDGTWAVSPGGLVTALTPVLRSRGGTWVGWSGDLEQDPPAHAIEGVALRPVPLSEDEVELYYRRMSNETLWPLFHDGVRTPAFDEDAWESYRTVNRRFAEAAASATAKGGTVWVQDYHLLLVPGMLREMRPDLRVGMFIHIPIPPGRLFAALPWRDEITISLRSAHLIGTQTPLDAEYLRSDISNPLGIADDADDADERKSAKAAAKREADAAAVGAYPISIDARAFRAAAERAEKSGAVSELRSHIGEDRVIFLGVDRLDYTKGIDLRLEAFRDALEADLLDPRRVAFVQIAVPSRQGIEDYEAISARVDAVVGEINGRFGSIHTQIVHYHKHSLAFGELVPFYRLADVMVVTPVHDGMNLVAKEFVATRYDGTGELILSEFAGASHELTQATIVNPHDAGRLQQAYAEAFARASDKTPSEAMQAMHAQVMEHDVHEWSHRFLEDLADGAPTSRTSNKRLVSP